MEYLTPAEILDIDFDDAKFLINPHWTKNDYGTEVLEINGEKIALSYYYFRRSPADYTSEIVNGHGIQIAAILNCSEYEQLYSSCEDLLDLPFDDAERLKINNIIWQFFEEDEKARREWENSCWLNEEDDEDEQEGEDN